MDVASTSPDALRIQVATESRPAQQPSADGPYKGLSYYEERDAPFFFGRERETQIVVAKMMGSRLTVLYGQSGVGKSSLLRAGAARHLMEIARENVERRGRPRIVVAVFPTDYGVARATWRDDPVAGITTAVEHAASSLGLDLAASSDDAGLCERLAEWTAELRCDLVIVLDQFEEYLLYHEGDDGAGVLATELPAALAQRNLRVNFLISIREDMLAKLDSFKQEIPGIFDNCIRISHLDRSHARSAIEGPIATYNELTGAVEPVTIEPELVDTMLSELETGRVVVGVTGVGTSQEPSGGSAHTVETPYLQLVMTRLWREETQAGSTRLRLATLDRLGHSERIVKTHLDGTMRTLPRYGRYVAARAFHHLVTPSGAKIAHSAADLSAYTGLAEHDIEPVLRQLTEPEYRILRRVAASGAARESARFEIFHDVLGAPILDWLSRYLRARNALEVVRSGATTFVQVAIGLVWLGFFLYQAVWSQHTRGDDLWTVWAACALIVWIRTTVVLARWRQRRESWAVPLVGVVASAIGPVTVLAGVATGVARVTSRMLSRGNPSAKSAAPASRARLQRFSGLLGLAGAAAVVLACLVPVIESEFEDAQAIFAFDDRAWFALVPLVCATMSALLSGGALLRPRPRAFVPGLVSGLGLATLTYFFSLLWWRSALEPFVSEDSGLRPGVLLLGVAGAGLVLVSASPTVVLEIVASIVGAGRRILAALRPAADLTAGVERWTVRVPLIVCAVAAAVAALTASFIASGAWHRPQYDSLFDISFWAGMQVFVPAGAAAVSAFVILFGDRTGERAAGLLSGCGLAVLALFVGAIEIRHGDAPTGAYLGAGGGAALTVAGFVLLAGANSADASGQGRLARRRALVATGGVLAIAAPVVLATGLGAASSSLFRDVPAVGSLQHGVPNAAQVFRRFAGIPQHGLSLGAPSAPVTLVVYDDPQCYYCDSFDTDFLPGIAARYIRAGQVRVVLRPVAFVSHDSARGQAAVLAAAEQNRAFDYEALLVEDARWIDDETVAAVAGSIPGLRVHQLLAARSSAAVKAESRRMAALARSDRVFADEVGYYFDTLPAMFVGPTGHHGKRVVLESDGHDDARLARAIRKAAASP